MIKWAKSLLGSSELVDKLVNEAINSKSEQEYMLATARLKAIMPFKIVQRVLVAGVIAVWVPACWLMMGMAATGNFDRVEWVLAMAKEEFVYGPTLLCFALYFGGGTIESMKKGK